MALRSEISPIQQKTLTSGTEQSRNDRVYGKTPPYNWKISMKTPHTSSKENRRDSVKCQR